MLFRSEEDKRSHDIFNMLNEAVNILDLRKPHSDEFNKTVTAAIDYLESEFYGRYCGKSDVTVHCVGHTHIDVAWLWTLAVTREKVGRSFATVLNLMKEYPDYTFMSSQPQLYKYLKEEQPALYEQVKQRIKEGRWEAEGGMWLEADCNVTSGESFVRQILFGTRFFREEFGVENKILWLPDVFGYSAALPQILKKSGIEYFMTTKITWNEYNTLPYDMFNWQGLDGSEVLTYFITTVGYNDPWHYATYNGTIDSSRTMGTWQRFKQKGLTDEVMQSYGYGDGGGGPTKEHLESALRLERGIPGCPNITMGTSLEFFERLEQKVKNNKRLPKWVGELYLEFHRGTYTSMGRNKRSNRKSELMYQDAEMLSVTAKALCGTDYPQQQLNGGWETILLNQFHDILPGSSIKEVYDDCLVDYARVSEIGSAAIDNAVFAVAGNIKTECDSVVVFNQLSFDRSDVVDVALPDGTISFYAENVPSKGYKTYRLTDIASADNGGITVTSTAMSNKFFDIKLDECANITSIYDKVNRREIVEKGEKVCMQAFEDRPREYECWEITIYYREKMYPVDDVQSIEVVQCDSVKGVLRVKRRFLDSVIEQDIIIYNDIPRIDFKTYIDWKQQQILLKVAFPVDIHAEKATYDIQFGNVERPTHWNTSWDYSKFEVCAHKWADLSEDGYGVSLLNDCKYGHDIKDNVMRLTLLKSGIEPNSTADREEHYFTYSLFPHADGWKIAGTVKMGYALNCPMYTKVEHAHDGALPTEFSLISVDKDNVILETVKKAEDSDDTIIRMYESHGRRTSVNVTCFKDLAKGAECDLMENEMSDINVTDCSFDCEIKPYEIKTFKLTY